MQPVSYFCKIPVFPQICEVLVFQIIRIWSTGTSRLIQNRYTKQNSSELSEFRIKPADDMT